MALSNVPPCNIDDIQSWWEVPGIAHFCSLFRVAFNLLDFDIEELEEALLTDGTEFNGSSLLQDLIVRLLSGCLGHNDISTFNYQMFLRRLFRVKCKEEGRENPFNTDMDFQFLPLRTKVEILHALCDFRLDAEDVIDVLKNLDSDSLRVHPLGHDENRAAYWYFYGTRLYKEEYPKKRKKKKEFDKNKMKKKRKDDSSSEEESEEEYQLGTGTWSVMCYTEDDWQKLADEMAGSTCKDERVLYTVLSEDFLPEIPRLFEEKERLQKKRMLENQPRRQSRRIEKLKTQKELDVSPKPRREKYVDKERDLRKIKKVQKDSKKKDDEIEESSERTRSKSLSSEDVSSDYSIRFPTGRQTNNSLSSLATSANVVIKSAIPTFRNTALRSREDLMTGMYKILDKLKAHNNSWPFREPVEEAYAPKYYAVIAKPMDLKTMEDKLDNGEYGSLQEFRTDFQLIVDNCRQYNGSGNEYTEMAVNLLQLFETSVIRYLESDDHSSDNDMPRLTDNRLEDENDLDDDSLGSSFTPPLNGPQRRSLSLSSISNGTISDIDSQKDLFQEKNEFQYEHQSRSRRKQKRKKKQYNDETSSSDEGGLSSLEQRPRPARKAKEKIASLSDKKERDSNRSKSNSRDEDTSNDRSKERSLETSLERPRPRINYNEQYSSQSSLFSDSSDDSFENRLKGKLANKKPVKRAGIIKNLEIINALELVSEEVTKDINKWLDDTPKFSDLSSNSNSPLHVPFPEDMDKIETEYRRRMHLDRPMRPRDRFSNDLHRRRMFKEQMGLKRRRGEIQRTIDRLQPGKSKGNLLSKENLQDASNTEPKPAKVDENAPKISLGKVLETDVLGLGIGDSKKESDDDCTQDKLIIEEDSDPKEEKAKEVKEVKVEVEKKPELKEKPDLKKEKPTPNLSAWFKAFGAPKAQPVKKKQEEETQKKEEDQEDDKKSPEVPARRQRKASTGSSVSERSSFSQEPFDVNSPRPSIDEPYLSPQQDLKYQHPPINGTIKVGFYQDTCFQRGTSEKSGSPRDLPSCSPRDLPSVSPRRTPYCSPRNTPISPRDYPNASPRTPYCSPRNHPISPNDYPNSSPRDIAPSPLHYTTPENPNVYRYRPSSPRPMSPREEVPKDYYATPRSPAPLYGGVPPYPSHLYYDSTKQLEYRMEKPIHPLKKRAYSEIDDSISPKTGGSFTPTREAMEQERTFTPTPGRMPGPSQPLRIPDPSLTMGIPHHPLQQHIMETYAEERNLSSPYYQGEPSYKAPPPPPPRLFPQQNFMEPQNYDRNDKMSPNQDHQVINYANRSVTPVNLPSPNSPLNYSNTSIELRNNINSPKEDMPRETTIVNPSAMTFGNVTTRDLNKSPLPYNRLGEMMPPKVGTTFNRPLPDLVNYNNQELQKLSVPLGYNQPDLMAKINYGPMDLMQPRYNYPELMHPKTSVYNHPIPEYMNKSHQYPIQSNYNRTIPEIMQSKVAEIQNRELYQRQNKSEPKSKKSRKKKVATSESSGFQQYIAPTTSEPLKTPGVPGSAFNFGPQLKEGFTTYLDDMRSPYYSHGETATTKSAPTPTPYFLGHPPTRPATYPHPFMNPAQYQQLLTRHPEELLRPVVLQHNLIPPPAGYPPGYIMHDPMNRHTWL